MDIVMLGTRDWGLEFVVLGLWSLVLGIYLLFVICFLFFGT
jgi:hypothetical protein